MSEYQFEIKGKFSGKYCFPGWNQYLSEVGRNPKAGNAYKQKYEDIVSRCARHQLRGLHIDKRVKVHYTFYEPDRCRDFDNCLYAIKAILDGLQKCKILEGDGQKYVAPPEFDFVICGKKEMPKIVVTITEIE